MTTANQVIKIAKQEIGYLEKASLENLYDKTANPGDKNYVKYWELNNSLQGQPWCLAFLCYCFKTAFGENLSKKLLCMTTGYVYYTPTAADNFKKNGQWYDKPAVGDIIFFKNSTRICHVGLVIAVNQTTVFTIEGNTSAGTQVIANGGGVYRKSYSLDNSRITGYGRPNYAEDKPLSYPIKGIDISVYQDPSRINYHSMKAVGVQAVVIKGVGKNCQTDKFFEEHYKRITSVGIPVSVYHYSYARTVDETSEEAKTMIRLLQGKIVNTVYYDIEDSVLPKNAQMIHNINTYVSLLQAAGFKVAIYTGLSFFKNNIYPYRDLIVCKQIWFARYPGGYNNMSLQDDPSNEYKPVFDGFETVGWQYTSSGNIPSVYNGRLDLDIFYKPVVKNKTVASTAAIKTVRVTANTLRVRNKPVDGTVVEYLGKDSTVFVYDIDKTTGWYKIGTGMWIGNNYTIDV